MSEQVKQGIALRVELSYELFDKATDYEAQEMVKHMWQIIRIVSRVRVRVEQEKVTKS